MLIATFSFILTYLTCILAQFPENLQILSEYGYDIPEQPNLQYSYLQNYKDELLNGPFLNIRSKRGYPYRVLESPGLRSHFNTRKKSYISNPINEEIQNLDYTEEHASPPSRSKREVDGVQIDKIDEDEPLPIAEKQYSDMDFSKSEYNKQSRSLPPYSNDYSKSNDDDDNLSEASINEGIKARAPRVNFVTQPKKGIDVAEARDRPTVAKPFDNYKSNDLYDSRYPKYYDDYVPSNNRRFDLYPRNYDRFVIILF